MPFDAAAGPVSCPRWRRLAYACVRTWARGQPISRTASQPPLGSGLKPSVSRVDVQHAMRRMSALP
eukprot:NODE_13233_length_1177_cov_8.739048.p7 GENE.NODE_13233_length_1177_cov_8.739048~~NODE_13233_length_1177_cov_8.739048.p7  ORF type:complete len:66 (-),score=5.34 NODE_13233_length_1177_cov_8.739048:741-938(-)